MVWVSPVGAPTLSIQPRVQVARLFGMFFETNKSSLLPLALSGVRAVKRLYDENPNSKLLIVDCHWL